ncbi:hypothetical protein [Nocardioides sp. SLBN-35]|uniref:hypothetical protein n=1 Tax=Nocardioides sp. SLBN-35 TaxID=2768445 RepID=UPI00115429C0|nr:hypothetical protein [Nocardioides sp. SLBN-35]TQK71895.1 hypothetical protein FBY23_3700 [Nocardioides sp. SLBN-35]
MGRFLLVSGVGLALALGACTGDAQERSADPPPATMAAPGPFPAETTDVPAGFREVLCPDLRGDGTGLTVRLVVPDATEFAQANGRACGFSRGYVRGVGVEIGPRQSLATFRKRSLDAFEDIGGDDEVNDIRYRTRVPGLGGQPAEELTWRVYNDGLPFWEIAVQAAGVRLTWSVPDEKPRLLDAFDVVRRSVEVRTGTRWRCPSWGPPDGSRVSFAPPKDVGWVEREGDHCRIYVEGSPTVLEYGAVDPTPPPLERLATRMRRDPEVTRVRLERGAGRIDGQRADRLTWTVVRTEETENYEPPGTWRIVVLQSPAARVEWGGTPQWWRTHRSTYDDLVASVRVSPGPPSRP